MEQYLALVKHILENGTPKSDRTGTGTLSIFGYQMRFDLAKGFPLVTTKKCHLKSIVHELIWFLKGNTNIAYLKENKVSIWDEWADESGNLGPVYPHQWIRWETKDGNINQIEKVISEIKANPDSRRLLVNSWNVGDLDKMALPPCHYAFQFYVANNKLSCMWNQRSVDVGLGLVYNISSYALLTMMIAQVCNLQLGELIFSGGDVHIYNNHIDQLKEQLTRKPFPLPTMKLNTNITNIFDFRFEDFTLENYQSHPSIKMPVAV